jgi:septal ring factor EnvC (AmiA/AmiB activator)
MTSTVPAKKFGPGDNGFSDEPSEACRSLANFVRTVGGYPITDDQVAAAFKWHGMWQASTERHDELKQLREQKRVDRDAAREQALADAAQKREAKDKERAEKVAAREQESEEKRQAREAKDKEREEKRLAREAEREQKEQERAERAEAAKAKREQAEQDRAARQKEREEARAAKQAEREAKQAEREESGLDGDDSDVELPEDGEAPGRSGRRVRRRGEAVEAGVSEASF